MFNITVSKLDENLNCKIRVDSYFFDKSLYEFAYYLCSNGRKVDTVWYSSSMTAKFRLEGRNGVFYIKVFVKDLRDGSVRSYDSEKIDIGSH